jgi:hypothetical protein
MPIFMFLACASGLLIFAYFVLRVVVRRDYRQLAVCLGARRRWKQPFSPCTPT